MKNLRNLLGQLRRVLSMELGLFRGRRALVLSTLGVLVIPTLYAVTYLSSVWDPYGRADHLPVALVNQDRGATYQGTPVHLGDSVVDTLEQKHSFRYIHYSNAEEARDAVREGQLSFAVIIPEDFSEHAVVGKHAQAGKLVVYYSEGNQYMASGIAKRFSVELAHQINESLNTKRWDRVLTKVSSASEDLSRLREGVQQLRDGAHRLDEGLEKASSGAEQLSGGLSRAADGSERLAQGAGQVAGGTARLTEGMAKLGDGIRTMNERLPADEDLRRLADGTATLAEKNAELARGLGQLEQGAVKLTEGTGQLKDGAAKVPFVGGRIAEGAGRLQGGMGQLHDGLAKASDGSQRLASGATQVNDGVSRLTGGMQQLGAGIRTMAQKVPDTATLDTLATGASTVAQKTELLSEGIGQLQGGSRKLAAGLGQLEDGSTRIAEGLDTLYMKIPAQVPALEGDAQGLAASVEPVTEAADPVANNGTAFTPYFVALSLWVGAVMTSFLFHLRTLRAAAGQGRSARRHRARPVAGDDPGRALRPGRPPAPSRALRAARGDGLPHIPLARDAAGAQPRGRGQGSRRAAAHPADLLGRRRLPHRAVPSLLPGTPPTAPVHASDEGAPGRPLRRVRRPLGRALLVARGHGADGPGAGAGAGPVEVRPRGALRPRARRLSDNPPGAPACSGAGVMRWPSEARGSVHWR
ncbi:hypothetical protein DAT35_01025 [Vitiosangium sp. GDMCC 1.1324]|nr:YhgE/Pip domain-containing protein [Vitiosangium sp. GDMCC 1.1324]PTL85336.1 hypothetical protein DAT35_01025 [Vitiosangium sp. GDMCC 1.1324]